MPPPPIKARLHRRVLETLAQHRMLQPGETVGVAVSGGADSVALLRLLDDLRDTLGVRLLVAHFNHRLRGADADADEQFVAQLAAERGLEFVCAREDVAAQARAHGWNLEDAGRRLRYRFFSSLAEARRSTRVAVAHTADDQAETLVAHLLRGTGPAGLGGIYPVAGPIVRPLLDVRRQELRAYLQAAGQAWCEDRSNADCTRLRARIRHGVLPQLEQNFAPGVVERLNRLARLAREDEVFWTALVDDRFRALVERAPAGLSLRIPDLLAPLALPGAAGQSFPALSKRLLRRIFQELKDDRGQMTSKHVDQVMHLARECLSGHRAHLPGGVVVDRSFDQLVFSRAEGRTGRPAGHATVRSEPAYQYVVSLETTGSAAISVPEIGRRFRLKVIDWPPHARDTKMQAEALDADRLRPPLVLRSWRPGDSYRPLGRRRTRKLKRLLLENRVAFRERPGWPVLTSAGALAWARGLPVAEEFAAQAGTKTGLLIAEEAL